MQRAEVERLSTLNAKALNSGSQLDTARQTLIQTEAEQARLQHAVQTASARLAMKESQRNQAYRQAERSTLRVPFAGTINGVEVNVGDYVSVNQSAVEILDLEHLDLHVEVRGEAVKHLELGQTLVVEISDRETLGRLHMLQYDPDPRTHTHDLRVRLSVHEAKPGSLAAVELPQKPLDNAMVIPVSAILTLENESFVYQHVDRILYRKPIQLGPRVGDLQVVRSGLKDGDHIVARDVAGLVDAQIVDATLEAS